MIPVLLLLLLFVQWDGVTPSAKCYFYRTVAVSVPNQQHQSAVGNSQRC